MTLRTKFLLYLAALHVLFILVAVIVLGKFHWWFFGIEALLLISLYYGGRLVGRLLEPLDFLESGTDILREEDFSVRFRGSGQTEMDRLIEIYNKMLTSLQQERLRLGQQRGFHEALLRATPAGFLIFDFEGRISTANFSAGKFLGTQDANLIGRPLTDLDGVLAGELDSLRPGQSALLPLPGGRRVRCRRSSFRDRGFERGFILIEELTDELQRSERSAYEKLIRMMSHEVNNSVGATNSLLQSCLSYAEQLTPSDRQEYESALRVVISRNESLNVFMQQFAGIVRLPTPVPADVDLVELLRRVAVLMSSQCRQRGIEWVWDLTPLVGRVSMDPHLMEQVFLNIVKNAIEAIDRDGTITVAVQKQNGAVEVSITDSGGGLTAEIRKQVFTPFFTTKNEGNGIGLTLVREILTQHGFEFSLDGREGVETRFSIVLSRGTSEKGA